MSQREFRDLLFETQVLKVVLTRGETLYIPPYWFHCVVTLEPTISLNVWSQSDSFLSMEDVYALPIPFEEDWGHVKLMRVLQYFVELIIQDALPHYESVAYFVNIAVVSRYELLFKKLTGARTHEILSSVKVFCLQSIDQLLDTPRLQHITNGAKKISGYFRDMLPLSVREINVGNYLEHVAWRILGSDVIFVPFYYRECF